MELNRPSRIIVYHNSETNNQVFEPNTEEYNKIYSLFTDSCKQPILQALVSGEINKDVKVVENEISTIDFKGVTINFVYDSPQAVKGKNKLYNYNNSTYWYQSLIFKVTDSNQLCYNTIAIIPPNDASYYVSHNTYNLHYQVYSNYNKTYNYVLTLFN